jgi:Spy/CpxP family protein refolding chaperone
MKRSLAVLVTLAILAPMTALAQEHVMMPKGRWWKVPELARQLDLTAEQQSRLDAVFAARSKELIDLKAAADKAAIDLRLQLEDADSDSASVLSQASELGDARALLFRKEIEMLVEMRAELNGEQWKKLRTAIGQRMQQRGMEGRRPMQQRPGGPPRRN